MPVVSGLQLMFPVCMKVLGIVENMSGYVCPKCGHTSNVFGTGGADKMSEETGIEVLGMLTGCDCVYRCVSLRSQYN